jgi:predicted aldo/keto reductase-like oxidoreductase
MPILQERGIGAIGMKSLAAGNIMQAGVSVREAISYSLSQPIHTLVTGIDSMEVLSQNLEIARAWQPLTDRETADLLERVAGTATDGHLEEYKMT